MNCITRLKIILLVLLIPALAYAQTGTVKGRIYNATSNAPLPFVNVVLWDDPSRGTVSDIDGNYVLTGVKPGYVKLVASFIGFEKRVTEEVLVTRVHPVILDIAMKETSVQLQKVEIRASPFVKRQESPVSVQSLGIAEIEKNPGSNRDISRVIQALPGVSSTPAYRNDIIVRGGGPSENRFYLDGIEIPNLNHFATQGASGGPVGIINADFIREVDFLAGAFPASRGNALSSVIEFRQVDGNRDRQNFHATLGASDLALTAQGPLSSKSSYLFSIRRSYLQFLFNALGLPFLPTYNDYQFKYKWDIDGKNQFSLISIGSLDKSVLNTGLKNPDEEQRYLLGYLPENDQWSYTIGGIYRHFRENGSDVVVLSRNMLDNRAKKYRENVEADTNKLLDYKSQEIENKFRLESSRKLGTYRLVFGGGGEYAKYNNNTFQQRFAGNRLFTRITSTELDLWKFGLFGQASSAYLDSRLNLSLGLRTDISTFSAEMSNPLQQLSPRISASYLLSPDFFLNVNAGRYYQLPPYTTLGYRDSLQRLVNRDNGLTYIRADHYVLGLEYQPDDNSRITLEGFFKVYSDYPMSVTDSVSLASKGADYGVSGDEEVLSQSEGRTYGLELLYRNKSLNGFNIMASYTLVRSEFTDFSGKYLSSTWDNIHLLNITLTRKLNRNWDVGMKWRFVGGAPYTPYDFYKSSIVEAWDAQGMGYLDFSRFNSERSDAFHQLDVRVDKEYFFDRWSLMLYIDIQNVYNFKATQQSYLVNYDKDGNKTVYNEGGVNRYVLREIPNTSGTILPTVGIMVEF